MCHFLFILSGLSVCLLSILLCMHRDYFVLVKGQDRNSGFRLIFTLILANIIPDYPISIHWHFWHDSIVP